MLFTEIARLLEKVECSHEVSEAYLAAAKRELSFGDETLRTVYEELTLHEQTLLNLKREGLILKARRIEQAEC